MDYQIHFEALEMVIREQRKEINELGEQNERYFCIWTDIVDYLCNTTGGDYVKGIACKAIENEEYKKTVVSYIDDKEDI